jgi:predicted RNase H-like nuclease (RuvC/YqgF family)
VEFAEVVVAVIAGGVITQLVSAFKARADSARDDKRQKAEQDSSTVSAAKTLADAAASVVKLQDDQVEEFKLQIRALQAESSALNTRLDKEIQKRLRAEAATNSIEQQVAALRDQLSAMRAQFEMADRERAALKRENDAMKMKIFEMAAGVQGLVRQVTGAGLEPVYTFDVPLLDSETRPLGSLDAEAVQNA